MRVLGVRSCGQVAAVDRRAAGGIGNQQSVAEKLRQKLYVRRFAAPGAGAGEFEERFEELNVLHLRVGEMVAVEIGQAREKFPIRAFGLAQRSLRLHIDGLVFRLAFAFYRADFHAESAARAVFRRDLERITQGFQLAPARLGGLECCRGVR